MTLATISNQRSATLINEKSCLDVFMIVSLNQGKTCPLREGEGQDKLQIHTRGQSDSSGVSTRLWSDVLAV